jgi:hypothetical protein
VLVPKLLRLAVIFLGITALLLILCAPIARAANVYVVTRSDDADICQPNDCTLRGAINAANASGVLYNEIAFTGTLKAITLTNPLPTITNVGLQLSGNNLTIDGRNLTGGSVLAIAAEDVVVQNLSIINSQIADIDIEGGHGVVIKHSLLGLTPEATSCNYSNFVRASFFGVRVWSPAGTSGLRNGAAYLYDNVIGCHSVAGIESLSAWVSIGRAENGALAPNYIGVSPFGAALPNPHGIGLYSHNTYTNTRYTQIVSNVIAFNTRFGIDLLGSDTTDTVISDTVIYANQEDGICESDQSHDNTWTHLSLYNNGGLGINTHSACTTVGPYTHAVDAPYPVIQSVKANGTIVGIAQASDTSLANLFHTTVEVYRAWPNPLGYGEGKTYVGSAQTDSQGVFTLTVPAGSIGCYTAFETDYQKLPTVSTASSEFGPNTCRGFLPVILKL